MNQYWNFQRGGVGVQTKNPSMIGVWIFSGTQYSMLSNIPNLYVTVIREGNTIVLQTFYLYLHKIFLDFLFSGRRFPVESGAVQSK